jgi:hypothetical protein
MVGGGSSRLEKALAEQSHEQHNVIERTERRLREGYEVKLAELTRHCAVLQQQVETLEADTPKRRLMQQGDAVDLTEAELNSLRQEIAEQEMLLKGYQVYHQNEVYHQNVSGFLCSPAPSHFNLFYLQIENEAATTKLKQLQSEMRDREERLTAEIRRLHAHELNAQQQQKVGHCISSAYYIYYRVTPFALREVLTRCRGQICHAEQSRGRCTSCEVVANRDQVASNAGRVDPARDGAEAGG